MRKRRAVKRDVLADPIYNSKVVTKLINTIMKDGKKGLAQKIFYGAMDIVKEKTNQEPMEVLEKALENIMPQLEVKADRKQALGFRWLVNYARLRGGHSMAENLANEIIDASNGTGAAVKKREETHRMAEANKAFAHYRW